MAYPPVEGGVRALAEAIVVAAEAGDLIAYIEADRVFHVTLLAYSGNQKPARLS